MRWALVEQVLRERGHGGGGEAMMVRERSGRMGRSGDVETTDVCRSGGDGTYDHGGGGTGF